MWEALLPNSEIYMADYDQNCVDGYAPQFYKEGPSDRADRIHFVTGDQANPTTLREWISATPNGQFDVIIDDGGHTNRQQLNSLSVLFNEGLAPGGIYILEDIGDAQFERYDDNNGVHTTDVIANVMQAMVENPEFRKSSLAGYDHTSPPYPPHRQTTTYSITPFTTSPHVRHSPRPPHSPRSPHSPHLSPLHTHPMHPFTSRRYDTMLGGLKSVHCFPELCVFTKCDGTEPRCGTRHGSSDSTSG